MSRSADARVTGRSGRVWHVALMVVGATIVAAPAWAIGQGRYVETTPSSGESVPLVRDGAAATIVLDPGDWPGVLRAARDLQAPSAGAR